MRFHKNGPNNNNNTSAQRFFLFQILSVSTNSYTRAGHNFKVLMSQSRLDVRKYVFAQRAVYSVVTICLLNRCTFCSTVLFLFQIFSAPWVLPVTHNMNVFVTLVL